MQALINYVLGWLPFLLIIGAWFLFMAKFKGTRVQFDHLSEVKKQTATQADIARHFDRIATALEQRKP